MSASTIIFYILAATTIGGALLAVTAKKIFNAAVFLLFSLIGIAGIYFFLNFEFIAAVQIVVYVGGIVVLIIFSIFLTHEAGGSMDNPILIRVIFSALATLLGCATTFLFITEQTFTKSLGVLVDPNVKNIGRQMLSITHNGFILPFEVVSMLLLAAMIGCIVIAIKSRPTE